MRSFSPILGKEVGQTIVGRQGRAFDSGKPYYLANPVPLVTWGVEEPCLPYDVEFFSQELGKAWDGVRKNALFAESIGKICAHRGHGYRYF